PVGIAMGLSPTVRGILDPIIELYRPVPPLAYLPLVSDGYSVYKSLADNDPGITSACCWSHARRGFA
ncbi:IS66 family transposase, partial [Escherichia coli]|uniref:IS66 family transposase n=1 Tax=Escherichia coli TaxID=562 RepID=UPI003EE41169